MENIKGKWALVTGASRGIGALVAQKLADYGCNLVLHSRSVSHLDKVAEKAMQKGVKVMTIAANLEDENEVRAMLRKIDDEGLNIEYVLNNAGIQVTYRSEIFDTPAIDFVDSLKVNIIAPMIICYHYLPRMMKAGYGRIVNTTSGIDKEPQQAAYSASKAGLDKVTKDLGTLVEGTDVMINLIDPGWCRTDLGGPNAPNSPESAVTGAVLGVFLSDKKSGRIISAQDFADMSVEDAVKKFEAM